MERLLKPYILTDLEKKLVFLIGPRQAGKTWLAKNIASEFSNSIYLNYDNFHDRKIIHAQGWLNSSELLILDELHKMPDWKNYIKGVYDTKPNTLRILVTGSSRLDIFEQMGDSLAGRYYKHRLLPISLAELAKEGLPVDINQLILLGGFPEPYLSGNTIEASRWRLQYINSLLSSDVFEFDKIYNLKAMRLIFDLLRTRVGSPISYQSLSEDIAISPTTVKKYIQILEALYIVFRITPYSKNIARSLLKEPKIYFFDNGLVQGDEGAKLENQVALSLLKHVYAKVDLFGEEYSLHYLRTKDGQEIDFALVKEDKLLQMIEVKMKDESISHTLKAFHERYQYHAIQLVNLLRNEYEQNNIKVLNAQKFLSQLIM